VKTLNQIVAAGYRNLPWIKRDPDLDPLRSRDDSRDSSTNWKGRRRCPNDPDLRHPMSGPRATPVLEGRPRPGPATVSRCPPGMVRGRAGALVSRRPGAGALLAAAQGNRQCSLTEGIASRRGLLAGAGYPVTRPGRPPRSGGPPGLDRLVSCRLVGRSPSALAQFRGPRFTATVISPAVEPRPRPGIPG
jgi:hypothetical protein